MTMRVNKHQVVEDAREMLQEYVFSDNVNYCENCSELRYKSDIDYWECPYGEAPDSCVYSPDWIDDVANEIADRLISEGPSTR